MSSWGFGSPASFSRATCRSLLRRRYARDVRPLRYSINVTLDGCCDHRAITSTADEELHRHTVENLEQADALLFGRVTYELMRSSFRPADADPEPTEPFAKTINAARKYVVSSTLGSSTGTRSTCAETWARPFSSSNGNRARDCTSEECSSRWRWRSWD